MSDLLAAFAREEAAEAEREAQLRRALSDDHTADGDDEDEEFERLQQPTSFARPSTASSHSSSNARPPSAFVRPANGRPASAARSASGSIDASWSCPSSVALTAAAALRDDSFVLRPLVWSCVSSVAAAAEHEALRRMVGAKEIAANEALDEEIRALLAIVTGEQMRRANEQAKTRAAAASFSRASSASTTQAPLRSALPDSGARLFLSSELSSLLSSLRVSAVRSGVLGPSESDLTRILPRPDTARQRRVMHTLVAALDEPPPQQQADEPAATSAPSSRATTARPTARPSTARQRSVSSCSAASVASLSPDSSARGSGRDAASAAAAISSLSSTLVVASAASGAADPAAQQSQTAIATLRRALEEEHEALLQDVEYLQACLEIEADNTLEHERMQKQQQQQQQQQQKARVSSAPHSSLATSEPIDASDDDAPISTSELRDFNAQLKQAVAAEQARAHTLSIMNDVATAQAAATASIATARGINVRPSTSAPSGSPFASAVAASGSASPGGPLKAVRLPSAARVRPGSGSTVATTTAAASPSFVDSRHNSATALSATSHSTSHATSDSPLPSPALTAADPVADAHAQLLEQNADFFSDAPPATSRTADVAPPPPTIRPVIPSLSLGTLAVTRPLSITSSPPSVAAMPVGSPPRASRLDLALDHFTPAGSPPPAGSPSLLTSRSASKARSRLQAAQQFTADQ